MKTKFTLLAVLVAAFFSGFSQQVPNGSFETWTNSYTPQKWIGTEAILSSAGVPITSSLFTFKDTTTFTQGVASVKIVTDTVPGFPSIGTVPGLISLGTGGLSGTGQPQFTGLPFTFRPDTLIFDFKYTSPGVDTGAVFVQLTKNYTDKVLQVGFALTAQTGWMHVAIPLTSYYGDANTPDTLQIQFIASNVTPRVIGTTMHVDGVRFGYQTPPSTFTASITAGGPTTFCTGDSVTLRANTGTGFTYQWNLNTAAITGATSASFVAKASGSYTVVVDSAGTLATSQAVVITDTTCVNGINNIAAANLSVYPNPATTVLNINSNVNMNGFNLDVYDIVGRLVISQILENGNNAISVAKLANGTYIFRITDKENGVVSQNKFNVIK